MVRAKDCFFFVFSMRLVDKLNFFFARNGDSINNTDVSVIVMISKLMFDNYIVK